MDTKTLDAKLRKRAQENLSQYLKELFSKLEKGIESDGRYAIVKLQEMDHPNPGGLRVEQVLLVCQKAVYSALVDKREQAEVDAFIADVGNLKEQVEELEQRVSE
jgi:hypothetical protein